MRLNLNYFISFILLLITEIMIALYVKDAFIRPYVGDILVVILMYTFVRGLVKKPIKLLPVTLFLFATTIELAQYFRLVEILHMKDNKVFSTIIGTSSDIKDILCYLVATMILMIWEKINK